jgi:glucuronate isomerase
MSILKEGFLLHSRLANDLFRQVRDLPIIDYHSHLSAKVLAVNAPFENLTKLWIEGDHYKWRAMRLNGIPEHLFSGKADDYDKYLAWAKTVPFTVRNPLFHWSHLELSRYFSVNQELTPGSAPSIWEQANALLKTSDFTPRALLTRSHVQVLCTTDDPTDSLEHHEVLNSDPSFEPLVLPTFRPDGALLLNGVNAFSTWLDRLRSVVNAPITKMNELLEALHSRHMAFHAAGCRLSDHGLESIDAVPCSQGEADALFSRVLSGHTLDNIELTQWRSFLMCQFAEWDRDSGWVMLLHLGAARNCNSRILSQLGLDSGCDSVGDFSQGPGLNRFLNSLDHGGRLPKVILFNSNPSDNMIFATIAGNFFEDGVPGKVQYGPAWWFLDTHHGIQDQLNALSAVGLPHRFVGMVTDSRSYLSFVRHEYFRRVLCNVFAEDALAGLLPLDSNRLSETLSAMCYSNASTYFDWKKKPC